MNENKVKTSMLLLSNTLNILLFLSNNTKIETKLQNEIDVISFARLFSCLNKL